MAVTVETQNIRKQDSQQDSQRVLRAAQKEALAAWMRSPDRGATIAQEIIEKVGGSWPQDFAFE